MARAHLDRDPAEVAGMFDAIATGYDRMNAVMTGGQERRWRQVVARAVGARSGDVVLDLAAGTGASSVALASDGATVLACDFSPGMLAVARRTHPGLPAVVGDAVRLPVRDDAVDAATISFGLRNVVDVDAALAELARVTRPGGRLVVLETSAPLRQPARSLHRLYVDHVLPRIAAVVAEDKEAYSYLAESVAAWPSPPELADRIAAAGWTTVRYRQLMAGAVALHTAVRPRPLT